MKIRSSFVSNSSSSSFLLAFNDKSVFDFLKEDQGYKAFIQSLENKDSVSEESICDFLSEQYMHVYYQLDIYYHFDIRERYGSACRDEKDAAEELTEDLSRIGGLTDKAKGLIDQCVATAKSGGDDTDINNLAMQFADEVYGAIKDKWKNLSAFGYSDNDGEFWAYMEHDFMYHVSLHESPEHFAMIERNEH